MGEYTTKNGRCACPSTCRLHLFASFPLSLFGLLCFSSRYRSLFLTLLPLPFSFFNLVHNSSFLSHFKLSAYQDSPLTFLSSFYAPSFADPCYPSFASYHPFRCSHCRDPLSSIQDAARGTHHR